MNDVLAGTLDVMCEQSTSAIPQIAGGAVIAHGVTSATRMEALPPVPTLGEMGLKDFDFTLWHGLYAPAGIPTDVVTMLNGVLQTALADPTVRERYAKAGRMEFPADRRSPDAHRRFLLQEQDRLRTILARAGVKPSN